jgi:digeranylgeranylglycerophospholipid reductase
LYDYSAVVIGAGPGGSSTAAEIASRGIDVALIEKDSYPGETSVCGAVTPKSNTDEFEVPSSVIERTLSKWVCYFPKETIVFETPFSSFQRKNFDKYLGDRAVAKGANLITKTIATDVNFDDDGVTVNLLDKRENRKYDMRTKIVVFADGADTIAAKKFKGVGFQRRPKRTMQGLVYEYDWKDNPLDTFDLYFDLKIGPWGYGWIFPKKDILNVGIGGLLSTAGPKEGTSMRGRLDYFVKEYDPALKKLAGHKISRIQAAIIPVERAPKMYGKRMLLVGDAAGMVEPFSAGGNEYAMRGGLVAGKIAAEAVKQNKFDDGFLSAYHKEWRRSQDGKILTDMWRLFSIGYLYYKVSKNAGLDFYHYYIKKVAELYPPSDVQTKVAEAPKVTAA